MSRPTAATSISQVTPGQVSLVVLPFENRSADAQGPDQHHPHPTQEIGRQCKDGEEDEAENGRVGQQNDRINLLPVYD